jgi:hypothetical protein
MDVEVVEAATAQRRKYGVVERAAFDSMIGTMDDDETLIVASGSGCVII